MTARLILMSIAILGWSIIIGCEKELTPKDLVPKTVDEDSSLPSIFVNNTQLHSETYGNPDSAMIVVLHGGPGSDYRSLLNCKEFANKGYYVVFYDQRGSGLSMRHDQSSYNLQIMQDDLSAVIAHYRASSTQKVFLLGHSWGAILATAYINEYPTAISGAILAEPGGFVWQDIIDYVGRTRQFSLTSETLNDVTYTDQFFTGNENDHDLLDYKYGLAASSDGASDNPIGNEGAVPFWRGGAVVNKALFDLGENEKPDWTTNLQQYATKVLFVYSERNKAYGVDYAQKVSSAYPDADLQRIDGAGHDMMTFSTGWNNFYPKALNYLNNLK